MFATPHVLSTPKTLLVQGEPLFSDCAEQGQYHEELEVAKSRVGNFRLRHGDFAWKERVAQVDKVVNFGEEHKPVSRAYFKLLEITQTCALAPRKRALHLCDAPGGFAQLITDMASSRKSSSQADRLKEHHCFHLLLKRHTKVHELNLSDSGDILHPKVRSEIIHDSSNASFITADGAVDNETRPELTEAVNQCFLLACEVVTALSCQSEVETLC